MQRPKSVQDTWTGQTGKSPKSGAAYDQAGAVEGDAAEPPVARKSVTHGSPLRQEEYERMKREAGRTAPPKTAASVCQDPSVPRDIDQDKGKD